MFQCRACGRVFLSQREADLCTPRDQWAKRYGETTSDPFKYLKEWSDVDVSESCIRFGGPDRV